MIKSFFAEYAQKRLYGYYNNKTKLDCADLALSVLVDYASEEGLPLKLFSSSGGVCIGNIFPCTPKAAFDAGKTT